MVIGTLVFARCAGFVFRAPGFSHPSVPVALRAGFALALGAVILPGISQRAPRLDGAAFALGVVAEFLIGSVIGMTASLIYDAAYAGGRIVDDYVGVKAIAPSLQLVAPSGYGRIWSLAFTGAFFLSGAYRIALLAFAESFERFPAGMPSFGTYWHQYSPAFATAFVQVALRVAAPAIGMAFVAQVALGALSRVVPRFGSFTLAFPLAFAAALVAAAIAVPPAMRQAPAPIVDLMPHAP